MFIFIFQFLVLFLKLYIWVPRQLLGVRVGNASRRTTRAQTFVTPGWQTTIYNMLAVISISKVIIIIIIIIIIPAKEASYAEIRVKR